MSAGRLTRLTVPQAEVVRRPWGYVVYGWTHTLSNGTPVRLFVALHTFRCRARRAANRWVRDFTRCDEALRKLAAARR